MIAIHRFRIVMVDLGKIRGPGIVEKQGDILIEGGVIFLER
jgi:hypothetical protein